MEQADLTVRRIKDGTVIDHIDVGNGLKVLEALRIDGSDGNVITIALNVPRQLRSFAMLILKKRQMVKLSKAMIPGCVVGIVLGVIFDLHFGFHLNGYVFDLLASVGVTGGWVPEAGELLNRPSQAFLDPIHNAGTLLLYAGYPSSPGSGRPVTPTLARRSNT